jgi:hypothetical protein
MTLRHTPKAGNYDDFIQKKKKKRIKQSETSMLVHQNKDPINRDHSIHKYDNPVYSSKHGIECPKNEKGLKCVRDRTF